MRGGDRFGSGRPRQSEKPRRDRIVTTPAAGRKSPLEYMLDVMNDPSADDGRRDKMAVSAAPYVHVRADAAKPGKKEEAEQAALTAERGTSWEHLLQ